MGRFRGSLQMRLLVFCLFLFGSICALLGYSDWIAVKTIGRSTVEIMDSIMKVQANRMEEELSDAETFLAAFAYNDADIVILERDDFYSSSWFSAMYLTEKSLNNGSQTQVCDCFFAYVPAADSFISSSSGLGTDMRKTICRELENGGFFSEENAGKWVLLEDNGEFWLVRVLRIRKSYVGGAVRVKTLMNKVFGDMTDEDNTQYTMMGEDERLLGETGEAAWFEENSQEPGYVLWQGERWFMVSQSLECADVSLVSLMPAQNLQEASGQYRQSAFFVLGAVIVLLGLACVVIRVWVLRPVGKLTYACRQMRIAEEQVTVDEKVVGREFQEMNHAFNEMTKEIRNLKISVYEEQIHRQQAQIEYLKVQVTPHFLINCLNLVQQLTEAGKPQLAQQMTEGLSRHLRYMLMSGSFTSLEEEIAHVRNYVELSAIRYPGSVVLHTEIPDQLSPARVIPFLILNFVENTVKYEVELGTLTEIFVCAEEKNGRLFLSVWDTGRGFGQEILKKLSDTEAYVKSQDDGHIGIRNVCLRAKLILEDCRFSFSNQPGAGARVDIELALQNRNSAWPEVEGEGGDPKSDF